MTTRGWGVRVGDGLVHVREQSAGDVLPPVLCTVACARTPLTPHARPGGGAESNYIYQYTACDETLSNWCTICLYS